MLTDLQNSFTDILSNKFAIKSLLNILPHLKHVATLPCDLPLIMTHILDCRPFSDISVSEATRLRCRGIVTDDFTANLPLNLPVKEFCQLLHIWRGCRQYYSSFLFDPQCTTVK